MKGWRKSILVLCVGLWTGCSPQTGGLVNGDTQNPPLAPLPVLIDASWYGVWVPADAGSGGLRWYFGQNQATPLDQTGKVLTTVKPIIFSQFSHGKLRVEIGSEEQVFQKLSENLIRRQTFVQGSTEPANWDFYHLIRGPSPVGSLIGNLQVLDPTLNASRALSLGGLDDIKVLIRDLKDDLAEGTLIQKDDGTFEAPNVTPQAPVILEVKGVPVGGGAETTISVTEVVPLSGDHDAGIFIIPPLTEDRNIKITLVPATSAGQSITPQIQQYQFDAPFDGARALWQLRLEPTGTLTNIPGPIGLKVTGPAGVDFLGLWGQAFSNVAVDNRSGTLGSITKGSTAVGLNFNPIDFTESSKTFVLNFEVTLPGEAQPYVDRHSVRLFKGGGRVAILSTANVIVLYTDDEGFTQKLSGVLTNSQWFYQLVVPTHFKASRLSVFSPSSNAKISLALGVATHSSTVLAASAPNDAEEPNDLETQATTVIWGEAQIFLVTQRTWDFFTW